MILVFLMEINMVYNIMSDHSINVSVPNCKTSYHGSEYRGAMDITITNHRCLQWKMVADFYNSFHKVMDLDHNFCRNPNKTKHGPWCFINASVSYEYCAIKYCSEYNGNNTKTRSGKTCLPWNLSDEKPWNFPDDSISNSGNKCRNPTANPNGVWCYVFLGSREYCNAYLVSDCISREMIKGYWLIGLINDFNCNDLCVWILTYKDSRPDFKFKIEIKFIPVYFLGDLVIDFDLEFITTDSLDFKFFMFDARLHEPLCINNLMDSNITFAEPCEFQAICFGKVLAHSVNLYHLLDKSGQWCLTESGFIRFSNVDECHGIIFKEKPVLFDFNPHSTYYPVSTSVEKFSFFRSSVNDKFRGIEIPNIKLVSYSLFSCAELFLNSTSIEFTINFTECCPCGCDTDFSYEVQFDGDYVHFKNKYEIDNPINYSCTAKPKSNSPANPILLYPNMTFMFSFFIPLGVLFYTFSTQKKKDCYYEINAQNYTFKIIPYKCCDPICHYRFELKFYKSIFSRKTAAEYYFIFTKDNTFSFKPDLENIALRPRKITCRVTIQFDDIRVMLYKTTGNYSVQIPEYEISKTSVESPFHLMCSFQIFYLFIDDYKEVASKKKTFYLVPPYEINITVTTLDVFSILIRCFSVVILPNYCLFMSWIPKQTPFNAIGPSLIANGSINTIELYSTNDTTTGRYEYICDSKLLDEDDNGKRHNITQLNQVFFHLKGPLGEMILPDNVILMVKTNITCWENKSISSKLIHIEIRNMISNSTIGRNGGVLTIPTYMRSAIYEIKCTFIHADEFVNLITEKRIILQKAIYFFPNLKFYVMQSHVKVRCNLNPDVKNIPLKWSWVMNLNTNLTSSFLLYKQKIIIFNSIKERMINISCKLFWVETEDKETEVFEIKKNIIIIDPFSIYFDNQSKYMLNESIVCNINSTFLETHPRLYNINWTSDKPFAFISEYVKKKHVMIIDKSNIPGAYKISCHLSYLDYDAMEMKKTMIVTKLFEITGVSIFQIRPDTDVLTSDDEICCEVSAVVNVWITLSAYNTTSSGIYNVCYQLSAQIITFIGSLSCQISYNTFTQSISRSIAYLDKPRKLSFFPDKPKIGDDIICFPYDNLLDYEQFRDVKFNFTWAILTSPKLDPYFFGDYTNLSISTVNKNVLVLSQEFAIFGIYVLRCLCSVTLRNRTDILDRNTTYSITDFYENKDKMESPNRGSLFIFNIMALSIFIVNIFGWLSMAFNMTMDKTRKEYLENLIIKTGLGQNQKLKKKFLENFMAEFYLEKSLMIQRNYFNLYRMLELRTTEIKSTYHPALPQIDLFHNRLIRQDFPGIFNLNDESYLSLMRPTNLIDEIFQNADIEIATKYRIKKSFVCINKQSIQANKLLVKKPTSSNDSKSRHNV